MVTIYPEFETNELDLVTLYKFHQRLIIHGRSRSQKTFRPGSILSMKYMNDILLIYFGLNINMNMCLFIHVYIYIHVYRYSASYESQWRRRANKLERKSSPVPLSVALMVWAVVMYPQQLESAAVDVATLGLLDARMLQLTHLFHGSV